MWLDYTVWYKFLWTWLELEQHFIATAVALVFELKAELLVLAQMEFVLDWGVDIRKSMNRTAIYK